MNPESSPNASSALPCYRFGSYRVHPSERRLEHDGARVELAPKAFETLLLLLENRGRLLEKEQFIWRLWPDSVVEEANLAHYISQLRRIFQERSPGEKFIETVPKAGYRFVAPVEYIRPPEAEAPDHLSAAPVTGGVPEDRSRPPGIVEETVEPPPRGRRRVWILPAVFITALLAATAWWLVKPTGESKPVLTAVPLTTYPGGESEPTFSPDGSQVAFASFPDEKERNFDIYVKSVGSEELLRLTFDPALDAHPSWSPDGSYIAFLRFKNDRFTIYTISPLGGGERKVYETQYLWNPGLPGRLLTCTPDSQGLVVSERDSPQDPNALVLVRLDTGDKVRLTSPPVGSIGDCDAEFSPDGRILTFSRRHLWSSTDLYRIDLSPDFRPIADAVPLTDRMPVGYRNFRGHAWRANGREIIASLMRGEARDFWRIPLDDPQSSTRLEFAGEGGDLPAISGSARRMVYVKMQPGPTSIWYLEDSGESKSPAIPGRLFGSNQWESYGQVSPDGKRIVFESSRTGSREVCTTNIDGSGFLRLTNYGGPLCGAPRWSPNSRWIAYDARPEGQSEIYIISSEGGQPRRITNDPGDDIQATWSRDGRWVYFTSNRTGRWQVWKIPTEGGEPVQITQQGGWWALESVDGRTLFFGKAPPEWGVYRMPVEGGQQELFLSDAYIEMFTPTTEGYYFWAMDGPDFWAPGRSLIFLDSSTGARRIVTVVDRIPTPFLSLFPDGKRILYSQIDSMTSDLYLVENFR